MNRILMLGLFESSGVHHWENMNVFLWFLLITVCIMAFVACCIIWYVLFIILKRVYQVIRFGVPFIPSNFDKYYKEHSTFGFLKRK